MNEALHLCWYLLILIQVILALFLIHPFILLLIFFARRGLGIRPRNVLAAPIHKNYHFGIIVTAHQETIFIPPIVDSLLKQKYPHFDVYVVADDCDISNLHFNDPRVHLLRPPQPFNTNSKSIAYAVDHFRENNEVLVIFDPDNLVHPNFLEIMNAYYNGGYSAVQGNLQSKNTAGKYAKMDTIGNLFNSFLDCDIRSEFGLSVKIWGCGVSTKTEVYRKIRYDKKSQMGGFDKKMQVEIAKNVSTIAYAPAAVFYDEKITDAGNFEKQRIRWINAYFKFFGESFDLFLTGIRRFNPGLAYFGYNIIRPPYFLLALAASFFIALDFFIDKKLMTGWIIVCCLFALSFLLIVMFKAANKKIINAVIYMPLFLFHQVKSLLKINMNKKSILKTNHTAVFYIDDILKNESS